MITIGWTQDGFDGYRPGMPQHLEVLDLDTSGMLPSDVAEAAFMATNYPDPFALTGLAAIIWIELAGRGFDGSQSGHYSLSVGDTVKVGNTLLECARMGWNAWAFPDRHNNLIAREGCDRCWCGSKYWENDRCVDCNTLVTHRSVVRA